MIKVPLEELRPGMIAAQDVYNRLDRKLFDAGTELNDKLLRVLKVWGIQEIQVKKESQGGDKGSTAKKSKPGKEKESSVLLARFEHADTSHPLINVLFKIARKKEGKDATIS